MRCSAYDRFWKAALTLSLFGFGAGLSADQIRDEEGMPRWQMAGAH